MAAVTGSSHARLRTTLCCFRGDRGKRHEDARDRAAERMVPCQHVAQAVRQTQHPLSYWHDRKDVIDQMRGTLSHPPTATARTDRTPLTGKRHEAVEPAPAALKPREATRGVSAAQEVPELLLDEPRQRVPLVGACRLGAERLEMIADDLIQHALGRRLRAVVRGRAAHAPDGAKLAPPAPSADCREDSQSLRGAFTGGCRFCVPG